MKRIATIILSLLLISNFVKAQDTLYIYDAGIVVYKRAVSNIDSITFKQSTSTTNLPVDISYNPQQTHIGDQVTFVDKNNNLSSGNYILDFGDGTGSMTQNTTHTYAKAGVYVVKVCTRWGQLVDSTTITITNEAAYLAGTYNVTETYIKNSQQETFSYVINITASETENNKLITDMFSYYQKGVVFFIENGGKINIPSQVVNCGSPGMTADRTFVGSGTATATTITLNYSEIIGTTSLTYNAVYTKQ